jgi:hypothetical protein
MQYECEKLDSTGLAFIWLNEQECNLREISKLVTEKCDDIDKAEHSVKNVALNFSWVSDHNEQRFLT